MINTSKLASNKFPAEADCGVSVTTTSYIFWGPDGWGVFARPA